MAVKAARERGRKERGVSSPNIVLPTSAHAAFEKGCYYFGLESRRVPVAADWRADPDAMAASIDERGLLQPVVVKPHPRKSGWMLLVAGERRLRGCSLSSSAICCWALRVWRWMS